MNDDAVIGTIALFAHPYDPTGWIRADGRHVSASEHPTLHAALGHPAVGQNDTFRLPNHDEPIPNVRPVIAVYGRYQPHGTPRRPYEPSIVGMIAPWQGAEPPDGCLFAEGQTLQIRECQRLFSLVVTTFGGDGRDTFKLPDLRAHGRYVICVEGDYPTFPR